MRSRLPSWTCKRCKAAATEQREPFEKAPGCHVFNDQSICMQNARASKTSTFPTATSQHTLTSTQQADNLLHLAVCGLCQSEELEPGQAWVQCTACRVTKPASAYSLARHRCKARTEWKCQACDFPECTMYKERPLEPKQKPYICAKCRYPPCPCGQERPRGGKYMRSRLPSWTCKRCKAAAGQP